MEEMTAGERARRLFCICYYAPMSKTNLICALAIIALVIAGYFMFFQQQEDRGPITDPKCAAGYTVVGEGCVTLKEACELQGDNYYYDVSEGKCLSH